MGGYGSTRWQFEATRHCVEHYNKLDIRLLQRRGSLVGNYSLSWSESFTISVQAERDKMTLSYQSRVGKGDWEAVKEAIAIEYTDCHYGGQRAWFICPGVVNGHACQRRVAILYAAGKYYLCRHCHNLSYACQQESQGDRLNRKVSKIYKRLGGSVNSHNEEPRKPKRMHWRTYERLCDIADQARYKEIRIMHERFCKGVQDYDLASCIESL